MPQFSCVFIFVLVERSQNVFRTLPTIDFLRGNPVYKPENPPLSLLALSIYDVHVGKVGGNGRDDSTH